jgi:protein-S-isoprenylcysteine O-methyltransferase Ste14
LAIARPASLKVRMQGMVAKKEKRQPLADAVISGMLGVYRLAWLVFIPIDVFYLHLLPPPSALISALGGVVGVAGTVMVLVVLAQNEFAAPNVQDQTQSNQRVVDTGLYGVIRHPFYAGALLMIAGIALWLESYAALIGAGGLLILLIPRIAIEESFLRKNLPGYADYTRRVRSRLIPYII